MLNVALGKSCNEPCTASLDFNGSEILRFSTEKRKCKIGGWVGNNIFSNETSQK